MILSKRERYIAFLAIGAGGIFLLYQYLFNPLWQRRTKADDDLILEQPRLAEVQRINRENRAIEERWKQMNQLGLKLDPNTAAIALQKAVMRWAQECRMSVAQRGDRPQTDKQFQRVTVHVSSQNTNMTAIRDFLLRAHLSELPIRVVDLQIRPKREGSEELTMEVAFSTLCVVPEKDEKSPRIGAAAREARP